MKNISWVLGERHKGGLIVGGRTSTSWKVAARMGEGWRSGCDLSRGKDHAFWKGDHWWGWICMYYLVCTCVHTSTYSYTYNVYTCTHTMDTHPHEYTVLLTFMSHYLYTPHCLPALRNAPHPHCPSLVLRRPIGETRPYWWGTTAECWGGIVGSRRSWSPGDRWRWMELIRGRGGVRRLLVAERRKGWGGWGGSCHGLSECCSRFQVRGPEDRGPSGRKNK